jgi:rhamnose transport system ATP-binding protein
LSNNKPLPNAPLLQLSGISKSFGGTRALESVELALYAGSITALVGENGAGKSTLVKILTGIHQPDAGCITLCGKSVRIRSPAHAQQLGISVIHQEAVVFDELSVAENIFVTARPRRWGLIDWARMRRDAGRLMERLDCPLDPSLGLRELSVAQKYLVQIARALSHDARLVIMDEPTAALSHHEAQSLLRIAAGLRHEGRALLFISHRFEDLFAIADRYVVFRDGRSVAEGAMPGTSVDTLIRCMVGRVIERLYPKRCIALGEEILRVRHLSRAEEFADISFGVRRGEILGVYGLVGAGRSELMQSVFGLTRAESGRIELDRTQIRPRHPADAIAQRIAYVPEDRQHQGAIPSLSISGNITLAALAQFTRHGWVDGERLTRTAGEWAQRLQVKYANLEQPVSELSGGNQQKVVLAKWLLTAPRVLILDEPTKGIDVGSKAAVHALMGEWVQQGMAIILVSSELPEVLGLSDRVLVMRRGRMAGILDRTEADAATVLRLASAA